MAAEKRPLEQTQDNVQSKKRKRRRSSTKDLSLMLHDRPDVESSTGADFAYLETPGASAREPRQGTTVIGKKSLRKRNKKKQKKRRRSTDAEAQNETAQPNHGNEVQTSREAALQDAQEEDSRRGFETTHIEINTKRRRRRNKTAKEKSAKMVGESQNDQSDQSHVLRMDSADATLPSTAPNLANSSLSFNKWRQSRSRGGRLLRSDPLITQDEKHLIIADASAVKIHSIQTSLLVRSLKIPGTECLLDFFLSPFESNILFTASNPGSISKWDWTTGQQLFTWKTDNALAEFQSLARNDALNEDELTCVFRDVSSHHTEIASIQLSPKHRKPLSKSQLYQSSTSSKLCRASNGKLPLVLYSENTVLFGLPSTESRDRRQLSWRELTVTEEICSLDLFSRSSTGISEQKSTNALDLVLGCKSGLILIYEDVLKLLDNHKRDALQVKRHSKAIRRLHWHRNAVETLKYSRDGSYIVSGGHETVLILWQLSTGRHQPLPHLSSPILNVCVSPSGTSYAIQRADNSAIVLATANLEPLASVSGLGLPCLEKDSVNRLPTLMALNPKQPTNLLCATSSAQSSPYASLTFLQTYSLSSMPMQLSRQALTRNSTTNLQTAPHGQTVKDPSLTHLHLTSDGKWLITVDEWTPDKQSLDVLYPTFADFTQSRRSNREIALRVWSGQPGEGLEWETNTRINDPHSGSVLAIAINPAKTEFATVGEDAKVRIWASKVRRRDGQDIKDNDGNTLYTWNCRITIEIEHSNQLPSSDSSPHTAALAYSDDGSALAVYLDSAPPVHLDIRAPSSPVPIKQSISILNPRTGALVHTLPRLLVSPSAHPPKLAFLNRYLIALSAHLRVWDLVSSTLVFGIPLPSPDPSSLFSSFTHLSSSPSTSTFALAFPLPNNKKPTNQESQLAIFNPEDSTTPIFESKTQGLITSLIPIPAGGGYLYADSEGRVKTLQTPGSTDLDGIAEMQQLEQKDFSRGLEDMFGPSSTRITETGRTEIEDAAAVEEGLDRSAAPESSMTETKKGVLDFASWGPLPVRDLFDRVVSAFARKPVAAA
ncbi:MAG: hypothetical protein Q9227_000353 [Pyrenula ochraceoflavens]